MDRYKLCVLGGSGFIGREVCRLAVAMGHQVVSVSRGGRPEVDEPWVEGVEWIAADLFDIEAWAPHLEGCEALVHCVGVVIEDPAAGQTFERMHRDSVEIASAQARDAGVDKFVLLSADQKPPLVDEAYLDSKRDAEAIVRGRDLQVAILRPTLVYGPDRPGSMAAGMVLSAASHVPGLQDWAEDVHGLRVEKVAMATLRAALEPDVTGVLDVDDIDHLGDAMMIQ